MDDKEIEKIRYDTRATKAIFENTFASQGGAYSVRAIHRSPYLHYVELMRRYLSYDSSVLELGAGAGLFTGEILKTGAKVLATDISKMSLELLSMNYATFDRLSTEVADMEMLPFEDQVFDLVASSGSLSYGDNDVVMNEVFRVLKPGGIFLCVDSLNNNYIYRINRWINYFLGERTLSTYKRMPNIILIERYKSLFGSIDVDFFGSIAFLGPVFSALLGEDKAGKMIDCVDKLINTKGSAFKFVMVARKV